MLFRCPPPLGGLLGFGAGLLVGFKLNWPRSPKGLTFALLILGLSSVTGPGGTCLLCVAVSDGNVGIFFKDVVSVGLVTASIVYLRKRVHRDRPTSQPT